MLARITFRFTITGCFLLLCACSQTTPSNAQKAPSLASGTAQDTKINANDIQKFTTLQINNPKDIVMFNTSASNKDCKNNAYDAAIFYITQYKESLGLTTRWQQSLKMQFNSGLSQELPRTIRYQQFFDNTPIYGSHLTLLLNKHCQLVTLSAALAPSLINGKQAFNITISPKQAMTIAWLQFANEHVPADMFIKSEKSAQYELASTTSQWQLNNAQIHQTYFMAPTGLQRAYHITLRASRYNKSAKHKGYIVSSNTGEVLQESDYVKQGVQRRRLTRSTQ